MRIVSPDLFSCIICTQLSDGTEVQTVRARLKPPGHGDIRTPDRSAGSFNMRDINRNLSLRLQQVIARAALV